MGGRWRWLVGALLVVALGGAAVAAEVLAHPDGCHRWHSCPSDDGSYVCGDTGHCSECPNNQYCLAGRPRNATTAATRTPRPTKVPDPTRPPRPTQTPEPPRAARAGEGSTSRSANNAFEGARGGPDTDRGMSYSDGDADAQDDLRGVAALAGTGAPLGAAPARPDSGPASSADARAAPLVVAEYAGVRVIGPLQWATEGEHVVVTGTVINVGAQARTMVLTLFLLDAQGARLGSTEAVLWDIAPGESRAFAQAVPPLAAPATDVSARIEPLVP
ncbi:MAG TPA: FxLYD domain-containing protein [Chloroflexota bacterium]|nr:FxLYD domain-containing protein [Chloroflexota bacterium]